MHARQLTSTSRALFEVFIQPCLAKQMPRRATRLRPQNAPLLSRTQQRNYAKPPAIKHRLTPFPHDEEISTRMINLVSASGFSPLVKKWDVINSLNRDTEMLVAVQPAKNQDPSQFNPFDQNCCPTCKIMSRTELREQARHKIKLEKEAKKNNPEKSMKRLEFSWAIENNDFNNFMRRAETFLSEGRRVEIMISRKRGGRRVAADEAQQLVQRLNTTIKGVEGAKVMKDPVGKPAETMTLYFEGSRKKVKKEVKKEIGKGEDGAEEAGKGELEKEREIADEVDEQMEGGKMPPIPTPT